MISGKNLERGPVVWMAYVSYPVTTAVYVERALRQNCQVITCGPKIGPETIEAWNLQNMKLPVLDQNMPLPADPDMGQVLSNAQGRFPSPDLYLWVESVPGYHPKHLEALKCPKACYLIDTHLHLEWHVEWAKRFDFVFLAQREYIQEFQRGGCRHVHWLPLACDPEVHAKRSDVKRFDVGFAGSVFEGSRRADLLNQIRRRGIFLKVERCFWDEMAQLFSESRIVFNNSVRNDLNMRVFEVMSTGSFLLTDAASKSGQNELFFDGEDLGVYEDSRLLERIRHYLIRQEEREHIAARGQTMVRQAHTYRHRTDELLNVTLRAQSGTPSSEQWRERSLAGLSRSGKWQPSSPRRPVGRSFIIPVVDASPEGCKEFSELLDDLQNVKGEVIVIFNSPQAAAVFKDHPRIDLSASLNVNVGVARAWNIGVHMASEPTLFVINADLRISAATVEALEEALWTLPSAGIVGPEGSYFGFYTYEDILWFHHGVELDSPKAVDAVSGFLFATKRDLFLKKVLQFEDRYTPCFTEEWDLGLQAKQAGYKSYVVPVKDYRHEWGVSADPERVISYLTGKKDRAGEILARNKIQFWRKWLAINGQMPEPSIEPNAPKISCNSDRGLLESLIAQEVGARAKTVESPQVVLIHSRESMPEILNFLGLLNEGAEIGVQQGLFSEHILRYWSGKRLFSIDPWCEWDPNEYVDPANVRQDKQEMVYQEARERLSAFGDRSEILRMTSIDASRDFADRSLDFVYIDAQHHLSAIREDLVAWYPKVKPGGLLCGHDYRDVPDIEKVCGVRTAVNEFCALHRFRRLLISQVDSSWFIPVPE